MQKTSSERKQEMLLNFINNNLISTRKKYILSTDKISTYVTKQNKLTDYLIEKHLNQEITVGIFSGKVASKFMLLDVDVVSDINKAQKYTLDILNFLEEKYGVKEENTLVVYSGLKGYHIYILFDDMMSNNVIKDAYNKLLVSLNITSNEVELRPKFSNAVKLPFSKHPTTKNYCGLVNPFRNFQQISELGVSEKEPMIREDFTENVNSFKISIEKCKKYAQEVRKLRKNLPQSNKLGETLLPKNKMILCKSILAKNQLLSAHTRHNSTLMLAMYCKQLGHTSSETKEIIKEVLVNTYRTNRSFISQSTSKLKMVLEVDRLVDLTYSRNYKFNATDLVVSISENEMRTIMSLKSNIRNIALCLLIHSKRYQPLINEGVFSMSYRQLSDYGINTSFKYIYNAYVELEDLGLIELTNKELLASQSAYKDTTEFKVLFRETIKSSKYLMENSEGNQESEEENSSPENMMKVLRLNLGEMLIEDLDADKLSAVLLEESELKTYYTKSTFYRKIKSYLEDIKLILGAEVITDDELMSDISSIILEESENQAKIKAEVLKEKLYALILQKSTKEIIKDKLQISNIISCILMYKKIRIDLLPKNVDGDSDTQDLRAV